MTDQEELIVASNRVAQLAEDLKAAQALYDALFCHPKNNKTTDQQLAETTINNMLEDFASSDCEGAYNCGSPQYTQQFYVNGVLYEGILDVEYNRYDKTHYYVENTDFTVRKVEPT